MSNIAIIEADIFAVETQFNRVLVDPSMSFQREAGFAIQLLEANEYLLKVALGNRQSVTNAVINIASIGISLNPAKKQSYLVPRDGKICLDISFMGLIDLAVQDGAIKWAKAELVFEKDGFLVNGICVAPTHTYNPFSKDRGEFVGVYCVWKTADGDMLSEMMASDDVLRIRGRSEAYKKAQKGPWATDFGEMARKTVVKRASKYWASASDRLGSAIQLLNTEGVEGFAPYSDEHRAVAGAVVLPVVLAPDALPPFPPERLSQNKWRAQVQAGNMTPQHAIATLSNKYSLSAEQVLEIENLAPVDADVAA
jgi:recombination protein RecT